MKKIFNEKLNETVYQETLENGLEVLICHKPGFRNSVCCLSTPFGAINLHQNINHEEITWHAGLAHFLEHKLFEKQDVDVLSIFTNLGANANAYTSYQETNYYFSTTSDLVNPLNLLLDFVQSIDLTVESVEKEKGIIIEELRMYQEIPNFRLVMSAFNGLYHQHPLKYDIAGSVESVNAITKEELQACYHANYHPSQMTLSIVTSQDPETVLSIVKDNQRKKQFDDKVLVENRSVDEPQSVFNNYQLLKMNVQQSKNCITYKQNISFSSNFDAFMNTMMMKMILDMNFSSMDDDYQQAIDQLVINDSFSTSAEFALDYGFVQFVGESESLKTLSDFVHDKINHLRVDEQLLTQIKKRYLGQNISDLGDFESVAFDLVKFNQLDTTLFDVIEAIESISLQDLEHLLNQLDFSQEGVVSIISEKR